MFVSAAPVLLALPRNGESGSSSPATTIIRTATTTIRRRRRTIRIIRMYNIDVLTHNADVYTFLYVVLHITLM
jgi:hypothetical protein